MGIGGYEEEAAELIVDRHFRQLFKQDANVALVKASHKVPAKPIQHRLPYYRTGMHAKMGDSA